MAHFNFENRKVHYRITGTGDPLLLLHGNTVSSKMFDFILRKYKKKFQVILIDFPGHGKSERLKEFETDFWYYNSKVCYTLIQGLGFEKTAVVGTSGGALVAINLALEHPDVVSYLIADSFEGELPLDSYIKSLRNDRQKDKRKILAKLFWLYNHGLDWKSIVDKDTNVNIEFYKTGKSFFHKSIAELNVPTLITGSKKDEYCNNLDRIYDKLKIKNRAIDVHLFEEGNHPAMLSNKDAFFNLITSRLK